MTNGLARAWRLRTMLPPEWRSRARHVVDACGKPIGSLHAASVTGLVGLTVDDGPDPRWTPPLLDVLAAHGCRATFFVLAYRALRYPDILRATVAAGHEIALHGWDHTRLTALPPSEVLARSRHAKAVVEDLSGSPVRWFRPPFGAQSLRSYLAVRRLGMEVVVWSATPRDWEDGEPDEVAGRVLADVRDGDILLTHDGVEVPAGDSAPTFDRAAMFGALLDGLASRGLRATALENLVRSGPARYTAWFRP